MRQLEKCALKVKDCSQKDQPAGILDCHHFYHCPNGKPYSCQNKGSKCGATYKNIAHGWTEAARMEPYKCPKDKDDTC